MILGIDPGKQSGLAIVVSSELLSLETLNPQEILEAIETYGKLVPPEGLVVVCEDSRLQPIFSRGTNARAAGRIARSVGMIDGQCRDIEDACKRLGISFFGISPKGKGKKLNSEQVNKLTGWIGRSNQHERDAAMVAWPYRNLGRFVK